MEFLSKLKSTKFKNLEHEGFSHGSQSGLPENALAEIDAHVNQEEADTQHKYVEQTKALEGKLEHLESILPEVQSRWCALQERIGDDSPGLLLPVALVFGGIFALFSEAVMVAPSLDPYGIVNPLDQYVFAFGIAFASSIFFHYAYDAIHAESIANATRWLVGLFGAGTVLALVFFGIVRGRQIAFAAELSSNPVGEFLGRYPILTSIVFVCLTLGFPIAAAVATTNGLEQIRHWRRFISARGDFDYVPKELPRIKKQLEAEKEKLCHQIKSLEEKRKCWRHDYLVYHEKGVILGTRQMPLWMVWLRAFTLGTLAFCVFLLFLPRAVHLAIPVFAAAWINFYHERAHPTPAQQFHHQNIQFRDGNPTLSSQACLAFNTPAKPRFGQGDQQ